MDISEPSAQLPLWRCAGSDRRARYFLLGDPVSASILDPKFRYTNSASTDIAKTFARIRREQAEALKRQQADLAEASKKVTKIKGVK